VADNFASAVIAFWRDHMDRTLEAVEDVRFVLEPDLERFVVVVPQCSHLAIKFLLLSYIQFSLDYIFVATRS
jgi:hypothetical protein